MQIQDPPTAAISEERPLAECGRCGTSNGETPHLISSEYGETQHWCQFCFESDANTCHRCRLNFEQTETSNDDRDYVYCNRCVNLGYGQFSNDEDDDDDNDDCCYESGTNVLDCLGVASPDPRELRFGFEIELNSDSRSNRQDAVNVFIDTFQSLGIVKRDGSIGDGGSGLELVSLPLTLDDSRFLIGRLFPKDLLPWGTFTDESCGMHVHVSRAPLSDAQVARLLRFVHAPSNYAPIARLAGRELFGSRWASIDHRSGALREVYNASAPSGRRIRDGYRYSAVNLTNVDTIEFRIFASTTCVERARANLEACAAMLDFCASARASLRETIEFQAFVEYVDKHSRTFPHLATLLKAETLEAVLPIATAA